MKRSVQSKLALPVLATATGTFYFQVTPDHAHSPNPGYLSGISIRSKPKKATVK